MNPAPVPLGLKRDRQVGRLRRKSTFQIFFFFLRVGSSGNRGILVVWRNKNLFQVQVKCPFFDYFGKANYNLGDRLFWKMEALLIKFVL